MWEGGDGGGRMSTQGWGGEGGGAGVEGVCVCGDTTHRGGEGRGKGGGGGGGWKGG